MKDLKLTNGDITIPNHDIALVTENELLIQKITQVLGTNIGEL